MGKRKTLLAVAPIKRAMKDTSGAKLVANDATDYVRDIVEEEIKGLTSSAMKLVKIAKRTKITAADLAAAADMRCTWKPGKMTVYKGDQLDVALAPIRNAMKKVGASLVAEDAVLWMANFAYELIREISTKASALVKHAGRSKVMNKDVQAIAKGLGL